MTTAILVIGIACLVLLIITTWITYHILGIATALAYGTQELIRLTTICYAHLNYTNSTLKLVLDDLETKNTNRLQKAIDNNDFTTANYYKSILETIVNLKTMTNEEIEEVNN